MRALTPLAVLLLAPFTDAVTQEQPLRPGQRVRVTAPVLRMNKIVGSFQEFRSDTLVLADSVLICALSDVTRLEVSHGRQAQWLKGVGIGFVLGAVTGVTGGVIYCSVSDECHGDPFSPVAILAIFAGVSGATGLVVGGTVGGLTPGSPIKGAAVGGGIGAIMLVTNKLVGSSDVEESFFLLMTGVGVVFGAVVGAMTEGERWEEVPLDRLRVSIAPTRNGIGIGARIAF